MPIRDVAEEQSRKAIEIVAQLQHQQYDFDRRTDTGCALREQDTVTTRVASHALALTDCNAFRATYLLRCAVALTAAQGRRHVSLPRHSANPGGENALAHGWDSQDLHYQHPSYPKPKTMTMFDAVRACHVALSTLGTMFVGEEAAVQVVVRLVQASDSSDEGVRALCVRVAHGARTAVRVCAARRFHHLIRQARASGTLPSSLAPDTTPALPTSTPTIVPRSTPDRVAKRARKMSTTAAGEIPREGSPSTVPRGIQSAGENTSVWAVLVAGETGSTRYPDSNGNTQGLQVTSARVTHAPP